MSPLRPHSLWTNVRLTALKLINLLQWPGFSVGDITLTGIPDTGLQPMKRVSVSFVQERTSLAPLNISLWPVKLSIQRGLLSSTSTSLPLQELLLTIKRSSPKEFAQFVLDPSVVHHVISGCQKKLFQLDEIFHLTRTYSYGIHRRRLQLLGRLNLIYSWSSTDLQYDL